MKSAKEFDPVALVCVVRFHHPQRPAFCLPCDSRTALGRVACSGVIVPEARRAMAQPASPRRVAPPPPPSRSASA